MWPPEFDRRFKLNIQKPFLSAGLEAEVIGVGGFCYFIHTI
jgi:hypothetical protein